MRTAETHPREQGLWYERVLSGRDVRGRTLTVSESGQVHLLEKGAGHPVLFLHGSGLAAGFFLPLLDVLEDLHAIAPDLPGCGVSDPVELTRHGHASAAVAWVDRLLDELRLDKVSIAGHSGGGVWALRYALARPDRLDRLVLFGVPSLPGTRCPLPHRLLATPGIGDLVSRVPPSRESVLRFAGIMHERETLASHPDLVDLFLTAGRDPVARSAFRTEVRQLASPLGLLTRSGWGRGRVTTDELRRLAMPTLLVWGEHEPLGSVEVAQAVVRTIPNARLCVVPGGHAPFLGEPAIVASAVSDFVR